MEKEDEKQIYNHFNPILTLLKCNGSLSFRLTVLPHINKKRFSCSSKTLQNFQQKLLCSEINGSP